MFGDAIYKKKVWKSRERENLARHDFSISATDVNTSI